MWQNSPGPDGRVVALHEDGDGTGAVGCGADRPRECSHEDLASHRDRPPERAGLPGGLRSGQGSTSGATSAAGQPRSRRAGPGAASSATGRPLGAAAPQATHVAPAPAMRSTPSGERAVPREGAMPRGAMRDPSLSDPVAAASGPSRGGARAARRGAAPSGTSSGARATPRTDSATGTTRAATPRNDRGRTAERAVPNGERSRGDRPSYGTRRGTDASALPPRRRRRLLPVLPMVRALVSVQLRAVLLGSVLVGLDVLALRL